MSFFKTGVLHEFDLLQLVMQKTCICKLLCRSRLAALHESEGVSSRSQHQESASLLLMRYKLRLAPLREQVGRMTHAASPVQFGWWHLPGPSDLGLTETTEGN